MNPIIPKSLRWALCLCLLLAVWPATAHAGRHRPPVCGGTTPEQHAAAEKVRRELTYLVKEFAAASVRGDVVFFSRMLAPDYTFITTQGEMKNKAQALADYRAHDIKFRSHLFDQIEVHVYGRTAVVTNRATSISTYKGRPRNGVTRNTRVFVRRGDNWQCVSFQSTRVQGAKGKE